jgi:hypothetical protein
MSHSDLPSQEDLEAEIRAHLAQFSPKAYRRMQSCKTLDHFVSRLAGGTHRYMTTLVNQGLDPETAWSTAMRDIGLVGLDEA